MFLRRFLGAFPKARSPFGALARSGASPMFVPHSSTNTNRPGSRSLTRSCQRARASSSRSEAPTVFACRSTPDDGSPGSWLLPTPTRLARAPTTTRGGALRGLPRGSPRAAATGRAAPRWSAGCAASCPARASGSALPSLGVTSASARSSPVRRRRPARSLLPRGAALDRRQHPHSQVL